MPGSNAPKRRAGRPPVTSRAEILAAARRVLERDGWERLTLRRLSAELGIGTTTLYHHVRDREDLLVQLLNEHAERTMDIELPAEPRERIVAAFLAVHDSLAAWPWAAEILTADGFLGRLGPAALRLVEAVLDGAVECGCTEERAVEVFRNVWYYTVGEILVRFAAAPVGPARREVFFDDAAQVERFPRLAAIGDRWPELAAHDAYEHTLRSLVDGLVTQRETASKG